MNKDVLNTSSHLHAASLPIVALILKASKRSANIENYGSVWNTNAQYLHVSDILKFPRLSFLQVPITALVRTFSSYG